jgi:hypothetical protein
MSTKVKILLKNKNYKLWFSKIYNCQPGGILAILENYMMQVAEFKISNNITQSARWLVLIGAVESNILKYDMEDFPEDYKIKLWKASSNRLAGKKDKDARYQFTLDLDKMEIRMERLFKESWIATPIKKLSDLSKKIVYKINHLDLHSFF